MQQARSCELAGEHDIELDRAMYVVEERGQQTYVSVHTPRHPARPARLRA